MSKVLALVAVLAGVWTVAAPAAAAPCDEAEAAVRAAKIRSFLGGEARRARRWNLAWGIGFATVSAGQLGLVAAEWTPLGDFDEDVEHGLYVSAGKSAIGSLAHLILPLKIVRPGAATGDVCADLAAAERALRESGKNERKSFYLNHLGALALNIGGMVLLGMGFDTWREGMMSVAIGYPVALLHTYTQPRRAWHKWRRGGTLLAPTVNVSLIRHEGFSGLAISGGF